MSKRLARLALLAGLWCGAGLAGVEPFYTYSKGPLVQLYGLPAPQPAVLLAPDARSAAFVIDVNSYYVYRESRGETLLFDGENYRGTLVWRQGLRGGYEWGFDLPYVAYGGGFLDHAIYEWHDIFGLPQGGRDVAPQHELHFRYIRDGQTLLDVNQGAAGIGDVRLTAAKRVGDASALRASLKLPTGDSSELLGSGAADLAVWLTGQARETQAPVDYFGSLGGLALGRGDVLPEQQRRLVGFGSAGVAWSPAGWPMFQVQLDGHTPFYRDSSLVPLAAHSLSLAVGAAARLGAGTRLEFAVVEDILLATAPDVTFHLRLRSRY